MMRNWFRNFMAGRYGPDQLGIATLVAACVFSIAAQAARSTALYVVAYAMLFLTIFRILSHNMERRRRENDKFVRFWWPIRYKFKVLGEKLKGRRDFRFFRCPACGNMLRVPKGKGKVRITCPKCGERFERKT